MLKRMKKKVVRSDFEFLQIAEQLILSMLLKVMKLLRICYAKV